LRRPTRDRASRLSNTLQSSKPKQNDKTTKNNSRLQERVRVKPSAMRRFIAIVARPRPNDIRRVMANLPPQPRTSEQQQKKTTASLLEQLRCQEEQAFRAMLELQEMEAVTRMSALRRLKERVIFKPTAGCAAGQ
jgi:hypothetical protein